MKRFTYVVVLCLLLGILLIGENISNPIAHAGPCPAVNYATFGYDMARTSWNTGECILSSSSSPAYVWTNTYSLSLGASEGISTDNSQAFIGLSSKMLAVNDATGAVNWLLGTGAPILGSPTLYQNRLFFGSQDTKVYALNPTSGSPFWVNGVGSPISSTPVGFNNSVIVSMDNGSIASFDTLSGVLHWHTAALGIHVSTPAVFDKKVYVSALVGVSPAKSVVYALDAASGVVLWHTSIISGTLTVPVLANKQLYVGADNAATSVLSFDPWTGISNWSVALGEPVYGKPAADSSHIYSVGALSGKLYALDAFSGAINWIAAAPFGRLYAASSPTVANGVVYVGSVNIGSASWIYGFKTSGAYIWNRQVSGLVNSPITVVNGWFYAATIASGTSLLYGFKG